MHTVRSVSELREGKSIMLERIRGQSGEVRFSEMLAEMLAEMLDQIPGSQRSGEPAFLSSKSSAMPCQNSMLSGML